MLTADGLRSGYNMRNLVTLEALDRVRRTLAGETLDASGENIAGNGSHASPFVVTTLPFVHGDDTTRSAERLFSSYDGCSAPQNEGGPEIVYRLDLAAPATVRARVFDRGSVDVDVHLLGDLSTASCAARGHMEATTRFAAGTHYIVVDTWVGDSEQGGEYLLVVDTI